MCACVGAGGCADGTERRGVGCWAGSERPGLTSPTWRSTPPGRRACCSLKPLRCCRPRGRCVCPHALRKSHGESLTRAPWRAGPDGAFLFALPAAAEWAGTWSRGGGGGRPGEDVNSVPELARDGGRRGPEDAEPLAEGVGGLMEDEEDPTAEADEGGFTGVLLLKEERVTTAAPRDTED